MTNQGANFSCALPIDDNLRIRLLNRSVFDSSLDLEAYLCDYAGYIDFRAHSNYVWGCCAAPFRILGIISSFLTLGTVCRNEGFSSRCFVYYKAIAIFEFFYNLSTFEQTSESIYTYYFTRNYNWFFFGTLINNNIGNIFPHSTDTLTIFLSLERAVACLLPAKFYFLHHISVCVSVFVIAFGAALVTYIPPIFAFFVGIHPNTGTYFQFRTDFGGSHEYEIYEEFISSLLLIQSIAVFVSTAFAVAGMVRAIMIKRRLFAQVSPEDHGAPSVPAKSQGAEAIRQNVRLCFLQISLALPICLNKVAYYVAMKYRSVTTPTGLVDFYKAYRFEYLEFFAASSDILAYSLHFYLYVAFSQTLRDAFRKRFLKCL